jgi:hypothetical protein
LDVKSRVQRRVEDMIAIFGGPDKVIGKPSATGLGVHITFKEDADAERTPRPRPPPLPLLEGEGVDLDDEVMSLSSSVCSSDVLEAARQQVAQQRRDNAERIRIVQVKKLVISEAALLRQRAADLEREMEEEEAGLTGKMEIFISAGQQSHSVSTVMEVEDDSIDSEVDSNSDYARTEMCSEPGQ